MGSILTAITTTSALDAQLAALLQRLGGSTDAVMNHALHTLVCYVSERTRDGVIAAPLADLQLHEDTLAALRQLPVVGEEHEYAPLILSRTHAWLYRYWLYETRLAKWIQQHIAQRSCAVPAGLLMFAMLNAQQQAAVLGALRHDFLIIAGGPGTGKTTTVTCILAALVQQGIAPERIRLAAPTGKAAMRMQEAIRATKQRLGLAAEVAERIPEQAQTLHRLLGYIPNTIGFHYHKEHPLPADVVIVDEASMIDISLMTHLCEAIAPHTKLLLLGDKDQLASVETGSIFRDLCTGDVLLDYTVLLEQSHRFVDEDGVGQLAAAIREADLPRLLSVFANEQFATVSLDETTQGLDAQTLRHGWQTYLDAVQTYVQQPSAAQQQAVFDSFNALRILTPLRKGRLGVEGLNPWVDALMQRVLPNTTGASRPWYVGRPVMVTQNDYRQDLFNGDIGIALPNVDGELRVWFPDVMGAGQYRAVAPIRLPAHETAWAMTIHKSQGSEFERVLLVLPDAEDLALLGRELLYTAVTRAKQGIHVVAKRGTLGRALHHVTPPSSQIQAKLSVLIGTGNVEEIHNSGL